MATNPTETTTELIDTGARRDTLGRIVTPKVRRLELVAAWRQSGLTQAEFARRDARPLDRLHRLAARAVQDGCCRANAGLRITAAHPMDKSVQRLPGELPGFNFHVRGDFRPAAWVAGSSFLETGARFHVLVIALF